MLRTAQGLLLGLAFLAAAGPVAAQDSVAGSWIFTMAAPEGRMDVEFVFEQTGTAVTGHAIVPAMPEIEGTRLTDGVFEDGVLFFVMHVSAQGQVFSVEIEADVTGDEMVGEAYMVDMGQAAPFTAKRKVGS